MSTTAPLPEPNLQSQASLAAADDVNEPLRQRDNLLQCAAEMTAILLQSDDLSVGVNAALKSLGTSGHLSRAVFFRYQPEQALYFVTNEWCAPRIDDHATLGLTVFSSSAGGSWHMRLHAGHSVWALIDDVPASLRPAFDRLKILSTGCVPIFLRSEFAGMIAFDDCVSHREWTRAEIDTLTAAANSIGAALQRSLTAERMAAERLRMAEERHLSAVQKALEAERSSRALQEMVDAIAGAEDYDEFIRAALLIFQRHVGEHECGFWEYSATQQPVVRLKAWLRDGKMVDPTRVRLLEDEQRVTLQQLVAGFTVPDAHLGVSNAHRRRSSVLDHTTADAIPAFHRFALAQGWELELNVPLVAGGRVIAAVTVYRRHPNRFLPPEIDLAEALARQLAFGLEARRLAELARQNAIELATIRAREEAAANLVAELRSTNDVLRRCTDRFAKATTSDEVLDAFLLEATAVAGGNSGAIADRVNGTEFILRALVQGSIIARPQDDHSTQETFRRTTAEDSLGILGRVVANETVVVRVDEAFAAWFPESAAYHRRNGEVVVWHLPFGCRETVSGFFGVAFKTYPGLTAERRQTVEALATLASLTLEMLKFVEASKFATLAKERRELAEQKAREAEHSSRALQATVDALQDIEDVEQIVPRVLDIVARTFGADDCAVYDNDAAGVVRLMYWHSRGQAMTPSQLLESNLWESETSALVQLLADGFTVPDSYLGVAAQSAIGTFVIDHRQGTSVPEFDRFAVKNGWDLELNIGVGSQGIRRATLCIYRPVGWPFSVAEQALAESLAKQMALAIGMSRLAEEARRAALAVERQRAAEQRTADAANANLMLRRANDRLSADPDLGAFVGHVMHELCVFFDAKAAVIFEHEPQRETLCLIAAYSDGQVISGTCDRPWLESAGRMCCDFDHWRTLYLTKSALSVELPVTATQAANPLTEWMREENLVEMLAYPLLAGDAVVGFVGFGFTQRTPFDSVQMELANFLAQQISIALRLSRMSEIARQASLLDERNRIARDLHDTMAQSFTGIYMQLQAATRYSESNQLLARACIERAQTLARDGLREARQSVLALTAGGKTTDVVGALTSIAQVTAAGTTCPCTVQVEGEPRAIDSLIGGNILAICREAISNAQRYARASQITLTVFYLPGELAVQVQDNGDGFSPPEVNQSGFGLTGMHARAERIGGQVTIASAPGSGTTVAVRVRTDRPVPGGTDVR